MAFVLYRKYDKRTSASSFAMREIHTISGLTPGKQYKINISYDSSVFYVTGGLKVQGLGSEELTSVDNSADA